MRATRQVTRQPISCQYQSCNQPREKQFEQSLAWFPEVHLQYCILSLRGSQSQALNMNLPRCCKWQVHCCCAHVKLP